MVHPAIRVMVLLMQPYYPYMSAMDYWLWQYQVLVYCRCICELFIYRSISCRYLWWQTELWYLMWLTLARFVMKLEYWKCLL